ncbi:hypothetical protein CRYUN_Cryun13aG0146900 [Craigia yunnanensis]
MGVIQRNPSPVFRLRQLNEYSLAGRASTMEIPILPSPTSGCSPVLNKVESVGNNGVGVVSPALCRFRGGWGWACVGTLSSGDAPPAAAEKSEETQNLKSQDGVNSVLSKFRDLNIDENLEHVGKDHKGEMIISLLHQIKDLEKQVKERKDWAHQEAMQAARKLSRDLTELKMRMEREETQRMKGKHAIEDSTMKRLSQMENAPRKACRQVDQANAAVRRLETENVEISAEMEASKLSASESVTTCLEVAKGEKVGNPQCTRLPALRWLFIVRSLPRFCRDVVSMTRIRDFPVTTELSYPCQKWREELKAKELALAQVKEERRSKDVAEESNKRKLEALRLKIEIDFQRHKDDHRRLEQELSCLKLSAQSTELNHQTDNLITGKSEEAKPQGETIARLLHELNKLEDSSAKEVNCDRECIIWSKDEVSIVFLPCAHQVVCTNCNDSYGKKGKATCPCCRVVPIKQRIRFFFFFCASS